MATISKYLELYTQKYLLDLALQQVPDDLDKRQGAIIYDTLAICCAKLADTFVEIKKIVDESYIMSAQVEENIDYRVAERGIKRYQATKAERLGIFTYPNGTPATIPIGSLFSTIDENKANVVNYKVVGEYIVDDVVIVGSYVLECETPGTIGNAYYGEILPLSDLDTLGSATLSTVLTPARNKEGNDSVKQRYYNTFNLDAFGGNLADYKQYMSEFSGVGQSQIYPRTALGENIVISSVDPSNQPISTEYQDTIQQTLDPENFYNNGNDTSGMGLGVVPIGHKVKVMTPQTFTIDVDLKIIKDPAVSMATVEDTVEQAIQGYLTQVQNSWSHGDGEYETIIYFNQILTSANSAEGVTNVNTCTVNGGNENIVLQHTRDEQFMPILGTITVSEVE